jgi:large subunit ribosomal protein L10
MPKTRLQKQEILRDIDEKIKRAKSIVFIKFNNLKVNENEELRRELKKEGGEYYVAKKTLLKRSYKENKGKELDLPEMNGQMSAVFSYEDEISSAKIIKKFIKSHENKLEFAGGVLEDKFINAKEVENLADIPSKKELYAQLVGSINAPVSGFVNVLAGNLRGLVTVLKAISEK